MITENFFNNPAMRREMRSLLGTAEKLTRGSAKGSCDTITGKEWAACLMWHCRGASQDSGGDSSREDTALGLFCRCILESAPARRELEALASLGEEERMEALVDQMNRCIRIFKNHLTDLWRGTQGTFACLYRRVQQIMSRSPAASWAMYLKGQYYGHEGLEEERAHKADVNDLALIESISLPSKAPKNEALMGRGPLWLLGAHFHGAICARQALRAGEVILAVRNFVRWLGASYEGLINPELYAGQAEPEEKEDGPARAPREIAAPDDTLDSILLLTARGLAQSIAARLTQDDRSLFAMRWEGKTLEECAAALKLSGAPAVNYRFGRIQDIIRALPEDEYPVEDEAFQHQLLEELYTACRSGEMQAPRKQPQK